MAKQVQIRVMTKSRAVIVSSMWMDATDEDISNVTNMLADINDLAHLKVAMTESSVMFIPGEIIKQSMVSMTVREV